MIHQLKTIDTYFKDVVKGIKTFEFRENDRKFHSGDFLALNETHFGDYTGRSCLVEVTYVLMEYPNIDDGFVVLGIKPCRIETHIDGYNMSMKKGMEVYGGSK